MGTIIRLPKGASDVGVIERAEPTTLGPRTRPDTGVRVSDLAPPMGWARLTAEDNPSLSVLCEIAPGFPRVTQGYGGRDETERSQDISLTPWTGYKPVGIELPLWLDDLADGRSVESAVDILEALAGRGRRRAKDPAGGYVKPPAVIVHTSGLMPYDAQAYPSMRWGVNDLDWDDEETITNDAGNRVRAPVVATILQIVEPTRLQTTVGAAIALRARTSQSRGTRRYTVRTGETAISIARTQLGDAGRYLEILKLNGLRDPRALRPNAVIRLPR